MKHETRESWLEAFVQFWSSHSENLGYKLPAVRISCGFPSRGGLSTKKPRIGECWDWSVSAQGFHEIFINPVVSAPIEVLGVVIHELGHAAVGVKEKHGKKFGDYCKAVGLIGKPAQTAVGPELEHFLQANLERLGEYPHSKLDPTKLEKDQKAAKGRFLKAQCPDCGYTIRTTKVWLLRGLPTCCCGVKMNGPDFDADGDVVGEAA
jgi:hypothetical protein